MTLNFLDPLSPLDEDGGRGQLQDTLDLYAKLLSNLRSELAQVKASDRIVRPVPIESYAVAAGQIYTGREGGNLGEITLMAYSTPDAGNLACDGSAVSRTTYSDLFVKIGTAFGVGDGSTTFNLPDLRGRVPMGVGQGSGLTNRTLAQLLGVEAHALSIAELPSHSHATPPHSHAMPHTHTEEVNGSGWGHLHSHSHGHPVPARGTGFGAVSVTGKTDGLASVTETVQTGQADPLTTQRTGEGGSTPPIVTQQPSNSTTSTDGGSTSGPTGGSGAHQNVQPSLVVGCQIRYRLGPTDVIQTLPINWGGVNGQWQLDTVGDFPTTAVDNLHEAVVAGRPEPVVRVSAAAGAGAGNADLVLIGAVRVPYNFRRFRVKAFRLRTRLLLTGVVGGASATVTLRISDPIAPGAYLAATYSRVVVEAGGSIADADFVDASLNAGDLGPDWKPGYALRFEVLWTIPKSFATAQLRTGLLRVDWA